MSELREEKKRVHAGLVMSSDAGEFAAEKKVNSRLTIFLHFDVIKFLCCMPFMIGTFGNVIFLETPGRSIVIFFRLFLHLFVYVKYNDITLKFCGY